MLELICQQRYREQGIPVDVSRYRNHGTAILTSATAGPAAGHGAIHFPQPNSRVAIPLGTWNAWSPLVALKVELSVRVDTAAARFQTLIEGDGSFHFFIDEFAPAATVRGAGGTKTYVRGGQEFDPKKKAHPVPPNRWVTLGFEHDGYARMRVLIDGAVVGETVVNEGVPSVKGGGLTVGNTLAADMPLHGDVEELRIWRSDPKQMQREFLERPYSEETAQCWEEASRAVGQWMRDHPSEAKTIAALLEALQRQFLHGLYLLPEADRDYITKQGMHYGELWRQGRLGGPAMTAVFTNLSRLLRAYDLDLETDPQWRELKALLGRMRVELPEMDLDCDPAIRELQKAIRRAKREAR